MTSLKRLLDFYINSSLHVAVAVLSFCILTAYESNLNLTTDFYVSIFCASVLGYNFVKYFGLAKFYYRSLTTRLKYIQWVSVFSLIGLGYTFCLLQNTSQLLLVVLGLITFLYAIPLGIKTPKNLRSIGGVKIYVIAIVWVMTSVVLPLLEAQEVFTVDHYLILLQRIFIVIALMLPFEIRDLEIDELHLSTIPQKLGVKYTKIIGYALLGDAVLMEFFKGQFSQNRFLVLLFSAAILALMLANSKKRRSRYYTAFWVEAIPVFSLLLVFVFTLVQKP